MRASRLWRRWVVACTLGELVGFGLIPVAMGTLAWVSTAGLERAPRAIVLYAVAVTAGLGEGAVLAAFQLRVLRDCFPSLSPRAWIAHTAWAASGAWALGMLAPTLDDVVGLAPWAQVAIWIPSSILLLASIGGVQARVLARHVSGASRWLWANALGWLLGLPWTFALPAVLPDDAPAWAFATAMAIGGVLMGATVGAVTGHALLRMRASA